MTDGRPSEAGRTAQEIVDALLAGLGAFCGDRSPEDDVTLVVIRVIDTEAGGGA